MVRYLLLLVLQVYTFILIARIVLDLVRVFAWQNGQPGQGIIRVYGILRDLTDPVLRPIQRLIPPLRIGVAALDLSPIIVFALISILRAVVSRLPF
jgi:YggT family protein